MNRKYIAAVAIAVISLAACKSKFLDRPAQGAITMDQLANKAGVYNTLVGTYGALDGQSLGASESWAVAPDNWVYGSVAGGDAHKGSDGGDQPAISLIATGQSDPSNGFFNQKWIADYEGIHRANLVLALLARDLKDIPAADKIQYKAEAKFLRAHYYFDLKKFFNHIPWIDENTVNVDALQRDDLKVPNDKDIWPMIEADFKAAMDSLAPVAPAAGRVNKWAAAAYLAKTFLYEKKYDQANTLFTEVIANGVNSSGKKYDLLIHFEDNFNPAVPDAKNGAESVFAVQMTSNDGTGGISNANQGGMLNFPYNSPFRCCGFYQPTQDLVNSYETDANGLPMPDNYNSTMVTNDQGIDSKTGFTLYAGTLDPRLDWTVGRRGVPFLDWGPHPGKTWVRNQDYGGPYASKKNAYYQATQGKYYDGSSWAPGTAINVNIIRFADVLLMAAETAVELNDLEAARTYVNRVRQRAAQQGGAVSNHDNETYAYKVTTTQAQFDAIDAGAGIKLGNWVVRADKTPNTTMVLVDIAANGKKTWAEYAAPNYKIGLYATPWASRDAARKAVQFERKLELAMEGHRFFDLARWGNAAATMNVFYQYEGKITGDLKGASFTAGKNEYFPIPQAQIDVTTKGDTKTLTQNPGYN